MSFILYAGNTLDRCQFLCVVGRSCLVGEVLLDRRVDGIVIFHFMQRKYGFSFNF